MENQLSHLISNFTIKIKTAVHVHTYNSTITKQLLNSNLKNSRKFKFKKNVFLICLSIFTVFSKVITLARFDQCSIRLRFNCNKIFTDTCKWKTVSSCQKYLLIFIQKLQIDLYNNNTLILMAATFQKHEPNLILKGPIQSYIQIFM